jgi:cell division protein FtsL
MPRTAPRRDRPVGPLIPLVVIGVVAAVAWSMYTPLKVQYQASRDYFGLEREYDQLSRRNRLLRAEIAGLKTPEGVERKARESLGLAMPGENVYIVMPSQAASSQPETKAAAGQNLAQAGPLTVLLDAIFGVGR